MPFLTIFLVLAVLGFIDSAYLYYEHRHDNKSLVCPLDHDCSVVTESKWSAMFGIRNEILGMVFFAVVFALALSGAKNFLTLAAGGGLAFSAFLTSVQFFAIKDYCFYCLISALITLLLFIISFSL